ncbi:MAG: hypothetical protein U0232_21910 [Thermomicrobiales bacterium]
MTGVPADNGIICPVCDAENPAGSRFCERFGTPVAAARAKSAASTVL